MSGGWEGSNRRAALPADWVRIRDGVLERDGRRCRWITNGQTGQRCGGPATDVDHIGDPHDHGPTNLQSLCDWHHKRKTSAEGNRSPRRRKVTERRPVERHPGLTG